MIKTIHKHLFSTACLAAALSAGLVAPTMAATDSAKPAASTSAPTAKGNPPVVDELVVVESIQLTPVNQASKIIGTRPPLKGRRNASSRKQRYRG